MSFKYAFIELIHHLSGSCIFGLFSLICGIEYLCDNVFIFPTSSAERLLAVKLQFANMKLLIIVLMSYFLGEMLKLVLHFV